MASKDSITQSELDKLLKANDASSATITTKLDPMAVPTQLGIPCGCEISANQIPSGTFYEKLRRPSSADLPGLHSCDTTFSNKTAEETILKILAGDFTLEWTQIKAHDGSTANIINALDNSSSDPSTCPESSNFFAERGMASATFLCKKGLLMGTYPTNTNLLDSQNDAMGRRILHLFLRTLGVALEDYILDALFSKLHQEYVDLKWYKEAQDLSMIQADVAVAKGRGTIQVVKSLLQVGECLEANGSYTKASHLYQEIIATFWDVTARDYSPLPDLYTCAALASKRAGDYYKSEALYLKALHIGLKGSPNQSWDGMSPLVVNNVLCMYLEWREKEVFEHNPDKDTKFRAVFVLIALLLIGQVKTTTISLEEALEQSIFLTNDTSAKGKDLAFYLLRRKFATKRLARKALTAAVASPESVSNFRSSILRCGVSITMDGYEFGGTVYEAGSSLLPKAKPKDLKKTAKADARGFLKDHGSPELTFSMLSCTGCGDMGPAESFMYCPCRTIKYCGKKCQVADWKRHKKECSYQKAKMAQATK